MKKMSRHGTKLVTAVIPLAAEHLRLALGGTIVIPGTPPQDTGPK